MRFYWAIIDFNFIPCSDRHFYCVNIRLLVDNIFCVQTESINILLTAIFCFICFVVDDIWVVKYRLKMFGKHLYTHWTYLSQCRIWIFSQCHNNLRFYCAIIDLNFIPCSDNHFYCVNIPLFCVQTENINFFWQLVNKTADCFNYIVFSFDRKIDQQFFLFYLFCHWWHLSCQIYIKSVWKIFKCSLNMLMTVLYLNFFSML